MSIYINQYNLLLYTGHMQQYHTLLPTREGSRAQFTEENLYFSIIRVVLVPILTYKEYTRWDPYIFIQIKG